MDRLSNIVIGCRGIIGVLGCMGVLSVQVALAQTHSNRRSLAYREAVESLRRSEIDTLMGRWGIDAQVARSVVFPEVLRFNQLKDQIEVIALKTLYVQYGSRYANFSIGTFQMKPSFAEALERELWRAGSRRFGTVWADTTQSVIARKRRLERLSSEVSSLI